MSSSLSLQSIEKCGSFWVSVAATIAWPTLLALLAFFYIEGTITYSSESGGKTELSSIFGVIHQQDIAPGGLNETSNGITGSCCAGTQSNSVSNGYSNTVYYKESGFGSLALFLIGYPIRNFNWVVNSTESTSSGVQLARKIVRREILEEERIGWSKMIISLIGFVFGLVGLLKDPTSIPKGFKTMFDSGTVPDIRVFLLASTVASVLGFMSGAFTGLISRAPSARGAARIVGSVWGIVWSLLCLASFGVGCWQVNTRRIGRQSVWPMFIYWAPASTLLDVSLCGINPFVIFGIAGVILGIIGENQVACHHS